VRVDDEAVLCAVVREARSKALHEELILLMLWVCKLRCASVGGVAVDVTDEFALQMLRRRASGESTHTCVGCRRGNVFVEPADGGMTAAEYDLGKAPAGRSAGRLASWSTDGPERWRQR
jgi:hypothetical protein